MSDMEYMDRQDAHIRQLEYDLKSKAQLEDHIEQMVLESIQGEKDYNAVCDENDRLKKENDRLKKEIQNLQKPSRKSRKESSQNYV